MACDIVLRPGLALEAMTPDKATLLGAAVAAIEPWSQLNYSAAALTAFFTAEDPALSRHVIRIEGEMAGVIAVRKPWLRGPYLQLLALLPPFQGRCFGTDLLAWFERQASPRDRWLWLCYSSINPRAGAFYMRHGFEEIGRLPDLVTDGTAEVLMRKRVANRA